METIFKESHDDFPVILKGNIKIIELFYRLKTQLIGTFYFTDECNFGRDQSYWTNLILSLK